VLIAILLASNVIAQRAIIGTTDFTTGGLSVIDTQTRIAENDVLLIHSDARIRTFGDNIYVVNRLPQDNIIVLSKDDLSTPVTQYSTGNGSNPHEIAFASADKAYVTLYGRDYALIINPATGDSLGAIDLSPFADSDGLPEASQMAIFNGHLFIVAQRLVSFSPTEFSAIAVVDMGTDTLVDIDPDTDGIQGIVLEGTQPFGHSQRGGKWILGTVGSFFVQDGGLEVVNLLTIRTEGLVLTEETLGGDVGPITMVSDQDGYVVISDENFANSLKRFNLTSGFISEPLPNHSGGFTQAIAVNGTLLYVLDQGTFTDPTSVGVRVYDTATDALIAGPISTGLPPSDIVFLDAKAGDFDGDNDIDFDDFLRFSGAFGNQLGADEYDSSFDLSLDGTIDFTDFLFFAESFGK